MEKYINSILHELERAERVHPVWPSDILHQVAIINEESGEVTRAALHLVYENGSVNDVREELVQTAAMCLRMLKNIE